MPARLVKRAYLGNAFEYTFETELGALFVVSADLDEPLAIGESVGLTLSGRGVSVVAV